MTLSQVCYRPVVETVAHVVDRITKETKAYEVILMKGPVLQSPNPKRRYLLQTDASGVGIGAVLNQPDDEGVQRPIAFYSRKLSKGEQNYHGTRLECLA